MLLVVNPISAMSTVYVDNTVMVEMIHTHGSNRVENVYHVLCPGVPTLANLNAILGVFDTWERNQARLNRTNVTTWVAYSLLSIHDPGQPFLAGNVLPSGVVGALPGTGPPNLTVAVKWSTGLSGRSYRGRSYWIGLPASEVDVNGLVVASRINNIVTAYGQLRTALTTAGFTLVVCSKYSGVTIVNGYRRAIPRERGITTPITSITCDTYVDSQRKRLIRPTA